MGSIGLTVALFLIIATTQFGLDLRPPESEPEITYFFLPPPPVPALKPLPLPSRPEGSFKFDLPAQKQPVEALPLEALDISFDLVSTSEADVMFSLDRKMKAPKPNILRRLIIYERGQVDEKPVRTYAPSYTMSDNLIRSGARLFVLYRVTVKGRTEDVHILDSNSEEASKHGRRVIERSRFRPAYKDGHPVNVWVQHEMLFEEAPYLNPFEIR